MDDVGKKLLALIEDDFQALCDKDGQIQRLLDKMAKGEATMEDARQYSKRTGELLAKVYKQHITDEALPHAHMTWEIAQEAVQKPLITLYHLNTKAAMEAVKTQNEALGIHIKAQKPPLNTDRLDGIKRRLINAPIFSDVAWLLDEPVVNYSMSVVDDTVKTNADFQAKAGLGVKIIRTTTSKKPCDWCKRLAGTYDYADVNKGGHDVWKRHSHCYCRIEYVSEKDRHVVQNYRKDENKAKIADRKAVQRPDDRAPEKVEKRKEIEKLNIVVDGDKKYSYNEYNEILFKQYEREITNGNLSPLADFALFRQTDNQIRKSLIGIELTNGIVVKKRAYHFISRVIGSVEQKRNGVRVEDIKANLLREPNREKVSFGLEGRKSIKLYYDDMIVSVNPSTGKLIQVNTQNRSEKDD